MVTIGLMGGERSGFPFNHSPVLSLMPKPTKAQALAEKLRQKAREDVKAAFTKYQEVLASGMKPNVKKIAEEHNADCSAVRRLINGGDLKEESAQKRQKLTADEEAVMVQYLIETAKCGFPDTLNHARMRANVILQARTGKPTLSVGKCWLNHFLHHHKDQLSQYWSTTLTTVRGGALNESNVDHWYKLLQETIDGYDIDPNLIFAMDETCCFLDKCMRKNHHIGAAGIQQQLALRNENRETCTLIPIICADGEVYGPLVIFKGKHLEGKDKWPNSLGAECVLILIHLSFADYITDSDALKRAI